MRLTLCLLLAAACGGPQPTTSAPVGPAAPPADAANGAGVLADAGAAVPVDAAALVQVDALVCKYKTCIDICCDKDEVCSHGRLGDDTFPKCLKPHRP